MLPDRSEPVVGEGGVVYRCGGDHPLPAWGTAGCGQDKSLINSRPMKLQDLLRPWLPAALLLAGQIGSFGQSLTVSNDLQLWLRADAGVNTNAAGGVVLWEDQSG